MLTKISKIMVVFVTAASLAALGVSISIVNSGPSWKAEAAALPDYEFELGTGEKPSWTAKHRTGGQAVKSSPIYPDVIGAAYEDGTKRTAEEINRVTLSSLDWARLAIPGRQVQPGAEKAAVSDELKQVVELTKQYIEIDERGLDARRKQLVAQMAALDKEFADTSLATNRAGEETLKIRGEAERRRSDVYRLTRNLHAIEADHYQLTEQKRRILDMIFQMQGLRDRLRERSADLAKETGQSAE